MSYSFTVKGDTKQEAFEKVQAEFITITAYQKVHNADAKAAIAAAQEFIRLLKEPADGQEISISMHGSLGWTGSEDQKQFTSANVSVSAMVRPKEQKAD